MRPFRFGLSGAGEDISAGQQRTLLLDPGGTNPAPTFLISLQTSQLSLLLRD